MTLRGGSAEQREEETAPGAPTAWRPAVGATRPGTLLDEVLSDEHLEGEVPDLEAGRAAGDPPAVPFPGLARPFLSVGWTRLQRVCDVWSDGAGGALVSERARLDLLRGLATRLRTAVTPAAVLELNVARLRGELAGPTPEARFREFAEAQLAGPHRLRTLFQEYPVLATRCLQHLAGWTAAAAELLEHFARDRRRLARTFALESDVPSITTIASGLSDPHRGGRSVCRLELGDGARVVYKPKSLEIDRWFQSLLEWLNGRGLAAPHRLLKVIDRGAYGWVECVEAAACSNEREIDRFYRRTGSHLALFYVLQAVDFHFENVIAAGEHPVPIDLESLFHRRVAAAGPGAQDRARERLNHSVCSVGLLPGLRFSSDGLRSIDLSGIGARNGDTYSIRVPRVEDGLLDTMRIATGDARVAGGRNRPRLADRDVDPGAFAEAIVEGFRETYEILAEHRSELDDRLGRCADTVVRFIPRNTMLYARLLTEARHPDYLRDAAGPVQVFGHLRAAGGNPECERLWESELADLQNGDVPFFTTRPASRDLWDSRGRVVPGFFEEDALSSARRTLERLGDSDCRRQIDLVRKALVSLVPARTHDAEITTASHPAPAPSADECIDAAVRIGERLIEQAILGEDDATWIGLSLRSAEQARFELAPVSFNLYDGLYGLALFFAHLGVAAGRDDFEEMARRALRLAEAELKPEHAGVGGFSGRASALYALSALGKVWDEELLTTERLSAELERLPDLIGRDRGLDIIGGAAGCAAVLLTLSGDRPQGALRTALRACGNRLLETAVAQEEGHGWPGTIAPAAVAGFSHGAAGISWVLLRLADVFDERLYREAAFRGWEYERSLYLPDERNWRDRRVTPEQPQQGSAWCTGGAGLVLGRVLSLVHGDSREVRDEIEVAAARTLRAGFGAGQSLCHGDMGNADILLLAADVLGRDDWRCAALGATARVCREVRAGELRCGIPRFTETPSLMNGIAGIGYGLLRVASRDRVPAVLWLA